MARCNGCVYVLQQSPRVKAISTRLPDQLVREMLEQAVSRVFMVGRDDLWSGTRGRPHVAFARQVAMYLAHVAWGGDRTTVAHACGLIEDSRDDPMLDRSLELLEGVLRTFSPGSGSIPSADRLSLGS
jgi:chromosomal replication initiation ATPase DnaA